MDEGDGRTAEFFRQILDYDPETGIFKWRQRSSEMFKDHGRGKSSGNCARWNGRFAGQVIRKKNADGYIQICIMGKFYMASRIAWLIMTGKWPSHEIDHVNCDPSDNRFCNLREATRSLNCANRRAWRNNVSRRKGVSWHKVTGKWAARICVNGKQRHIGLFETAEAAAAAYSKAAKASFGEFAKAS